MKAKKRVPEIDRDFLIDELKRIPFIKKTNKGGNEIYIFQYHEAPNLMLEIARLREISYSQAGGGTGKYIDIDRFDLQSVPYKQLMVWNPDENEIIGGYRFAFVPEVTDNCRNLSELVFSDYYRYSGQFVKEYLPWSIELGRAFIQPKYQATRRSSKSLFALDNLFDGLGALILLYPQAKYFFGKVTLYKHFPESARQLLFKFLYNHFGKTGLVYPINNGLSFDFPLDRIYEPDESLIEANYNTLTRDLKDNGVFVPPMISAYLKLSSSMKVLGTVHDKSFGDVDETAILITIADMYPHKVERHIKLEHPETLVKTAC